MLKFLRIGTALVLLASFTATAWAQQSPKMAKIGYLSASSATSQTQITVLKGLRQGLKELGYIEGKNIVLELRFSQGRVDLLPELAADLLRQKVDIIVTAGPSATRAAKQATSTVPIVMARDSDPVKAGFIASLANPGGNITGNANMGDELVGKQMELLKVLLPRMSRIAMLGNSKEPTNAQMLIEAQAAARILGLQLTPLDALDAKALETAIEASVKAKVDAIMVLPAPNINVNQRRLLELVAQHRLPASYWTTDFVEVGGLMAYSPNLSDQIRRIAVYVDKILKGRKPADLPVEQPTRFDLAFNMKTAKALGLTVPQSFLLRVDRMIE